MRRFIFLALFFDGEILRITWLLVLGHISNGFDKLTDLQVMKWEDVEIGEPKEGEIRVKNKAIGLNFIDIYFRRGVYKAFTLPFTPGMEAVGVVTAVGPGLTGTKVGDVVGYAGLPMGSYAEEQILPANKVIPVPPSIGPAVAASVLLKGMTAQFLVRSCFKVEPGHKVLVHAAAGGVGSVLCQWANALGATVIGTVSTKEKADQAKEDGCHHVIMYKEEDFVTRVNEITSGIIRLPETLWIHGELWAILRFTRPCSFIRTCSKIAILDEAFRHALHCNPRPAAAICGRGFR